jgi:hypothetical protein
MRPSTATSAALALLFTAGCGPAPYVIGPEEPSSSEPPPGGAVVVVTPSAPAREPPDRWIPDGYPRFNPFTEARTWVGDYDCPQGRTSLTLRVVDVRGKMVRAIFDFHHAPTDAAGQYLMIGSFDEQTGAVAFEPGPWIIHPDDYVSVGMAGSVSPDGRRFVGRITHPSCGAFRLRAAR